MTQEEPNPLMRKKKTPEELAAEAEAEEEDEITSTCTIRVRKMCVSRIMVKWGNDEERREQIFSC